MAAQEPLSLGQQFEALVAPYIERKRAEQEAEDRETEKMVEDIRTAIEAGVFVTSLRTTRRSMPTEASWSSRRFSPGRRLPGR